MTASPLAIALGVGLFVACPSQPQDASAAGAGHGQQAAPPARSTFDQIGSELVDRTHAIPASYAPTDLASVGPGYERGRVYELRREAADAWTRMRAAAQADGVALRVVSAYRTYDYQRGVYDDAVKREGQGQNGVAAPGHSEHQLGTALDIGGPDADTILKPEFADTTAGRWLTARAPDFGFAVSYTRANQPVTGYRAEPWHYRYVGAGARARHEAALRGGTSIDR